MYMDKIDWNDPKFSRWHICNLQPHSDAQKEAFWEDDEVDDPPITEDEQIELCKKFNCKVELFHTNVCHGVEKSWPKKYFDTVDFKSLPKRKQAQLHKTMQKNAIALYDKYVNPERKKRQRHIERHNYKVFASFWEERRLRNRFERIKRIGENEKNHVNISINETHFEDNAQIVQAVNGSDDESPQSDIQNTTKISQSKKPKRSAETSPHENRNRNLQNETTPNRRVTRSTPTSTLNQGELLPETTTPDRCITRSASKQMEKDNISEIRPLTRSATKNNPIHENISLRRHQQKKSPPTKKNVPNAADVSSSQMTPIRRRHSDSEDEPIVVTATRRSDRIRHNILSATKKIPSKSRNAKSKRCIALDSFDSINLSFNVDTPKTPSINAMQEGLDISPENSGSPTVYRQQSDRMATNSTPDLVFDESFLTISPKKRRSKKNTEEYDKDFWELSQRQTSTQKE